MSYQRGPHSTDIREIWYRGLVWKWVEKTQIWLIPDTLHEYLSRCFCCRRNKLAVQALLCNYIVGISWIRKTHCCVSVATTVMRTRHSVMLYVRFLSGYLWGLLQALHRTCDLWHHLPFVTDWIPVLCVCVCNVLRFVNSVGVFGSVIQSFFWRSTTIIKMLVICSFTKKFS
jgi:hypothetical protein